MKKIFVIIVTTIITNANLDCDSSVLHCLNNHENKNHIIERTIETITTNPKTVERVLKEHPEAKVDTFLLMPYKKGI